MTLWQKMFSFLLLFSSGQTAVKVSGAEVADWAQCAAPHKPIGYWNLLAVFANLKRVIQCACFESPASRKGTPKCNLCILAVVQHLPRKWRLVSSSSLQRGHNGSLTLHITVRCRLRVLCPVRRYTSVLRSRRHCHKANCVSPGVTRVTSSLVCRQPSALNQCLLCSLWANCRTLLRTAIVKTPKLVQVLCTLQQQLVLLVCQLLHCRQYHCDRVPTVI